MVACISPAEADIQETLTTLQYASRARAVQNKVFQHSSSSVHSLQIKANISTAHIEVDTSLIETLREQLLAVQSQLKEQQQLTALMIAEKEERGSNGASDFKHSNTIADVISQQKRGIILERLTGIHRVLQVEYFFFLCNLLIIEFC
jgi:hypothetical protein